jgi:hypothetical protein
VTTAHEWSRRYQDLTADVGRSYDRVLRRHHELLAGVADGSIDPRDVQTSVQSYLAAQAGSSTRELIEASVGLLAGLLYTEAKYREVMLDGLLPAGEPIPAPPSPASIDITNWFQTLASYGAVQTARSVTRQQQLVERISSGDLSVAELERHGKQFVAEQSPRFIAEVVELGLAFARQMQRSSAALAEGLYDGVLGADDDAGDSPDAALVMELQGVVGSTVESYVEVENSRELPADIECTLTPFVSRETGRGVSAGVVEPARCVLTVGETRTLAVRVALDPAVFSPEVDYFGMLRVSGAGEREMVVQLVVRASEGALVGSGAEPEAHPAG